MPKRDLQFYNLKLTVQQIDKIQSRARDLLLDQADWDVGRAWVESTMEYFYNHELLTKNVDSTNYFLNGERRTK